MEGTLGMQGTRMDQQRQGRGAEREICDRMACRNKTSRIRNRKRRRSRTWGSSYEVECNNLGLGRDWEYFNGNLSGLWFLRGGVHVWQAIPKKVVYVVMDIISYIWHMNISWAKPLNWHKYCCTHNNTSTIPDINTKCTHKWGPEMTIDLTPHQ